MSQLNNKVIRDLWRIRGQALAIAVVIACGISTVVMSFGAMHSLGETQNTYYERYRFAEIFASVQRAPQSLAARISDIPGVRRVETRIVRLVTLDVEGMVEPVTGLINSVPDDRRPLLNDLVIRKGRYIAPGRDREIILSETFADAHGLKPGNKISMTLNGRKRAFSVVGIALSPEYIYSMGPGMLIPDDRRFGVMWMSRAALAASFDLKSAFNEVSLQIYRGAGEKEIIRQLDELLAPHGGVGAYAREDQISHAFIANELAQLNNMGRIIPPIFLAVAAFLINVVISRIIDADRPQIGLLKAFGLSDFAVGWVYMKLVFAIAALGIVLGFLVGAWMGLEITNLYSQFFRFPFLYYRVDPGLFALAALISLTAAGAGAWGAVRRGAAILPAEAMRPAPPTRYRRGLLESLGLNRVLSQPSRIILRHLTRWPLRTGLTIFGISLSGMVLVGMLFFYDSVEHMIQVQFYKVQRQDMTVSFVQAQPVRIINEIARLPAVLRVEPERMVRAWLRHGHRAERTALQGLPRDASLHRVLDKDLKAIDMPDNGLVLSKHMAQLLGVHRGSMVEVEILEGRRRTVRLPVSAVVEEYIGKPVYLALPVLNRIMQEQALVTSVKLQTDTQHRVELFRALKKLPVVAGISVQSAALEMFRETMAESMYIMLGFYVFFGGMIAVGVVYNSARISFAERAGDLACLRVLGFTRAEVSYILLGELAFVTLISLPIGGGMGWLLAWYMADAFETDLFRLPMVIEPATYGLAAAVVLVASLLSGLLVRRRVDHMDLIAVLKTKE